ncbi:MAG TPA: cytochrome C oxidase subunit I [Burkholderiaceae bacterium]|nr:cytochrome C oxidase subunit I [Burkholderiaceae bacterium]
MSSLPVAEESTAPARARPTWFYALALPSGGRRTLALAWLWLAVAALAASGVFSILLVVARAPGLQHLFPSAEFFRVALVVHVDLSVLVWFGSFAAVLWSIASRPRWLPLGFVAFGLAAVGTFVLAVAPFLDPGAPVMANYVPMLDSGTFIAGLLIFGLGFGLAALRALAVPERVGVLLAPDGALRFGLNAAAVAAAMTIGALVWSWSALARELALRDYYELLYWGPGHVLQFCWTLVMLVAWLWLASLAGARVPLSPRVTVLLFGIGLAAVFATPAIYLAWPVAAVEFQKLFTWQMRFGGGLAIAPVVAAIALGLARAQRVTRAHRPARAALLASVLLFSAGGAIGFLIQGSDVRIPAHYHGCIVGITLALMGLTYALLPHLGFTRPLPRLANWQPWLYGGGQLLHIIGLVWSGGYGVQRKVAGAEQVLRSTAEVAGMGLMGLGGLIAVAGGFAFAVVVLGALRGRGAGA